MTPWTRRFLIIGLVIIIVASMYFGYFDELIEPVIVWLNK